MADPVAPLRHTIRATVRFREADLLGIVWHGHYVKFLEDARQVMGAYIGLGYEDFMREGFAGPLVDMRLQYKRPARYGDKIDITAMLHWSEVPKLRYTYEIRRVADGELLTLAETVQVLLHPDGQLALNFPPFLEAFRTRWQQGQLRIPPGPEASPFG